jgi:hypothetical protein
MVRKKERQINHDKFGSTKARRLVLLLSSPLGSSLSPGQAPTNALFRRFWVAGRCDKLFVVRRVGAGTVVPSGKHGNIVVAAVLLVLVTRVHDLCFVTFLLTFVELERKGKNHQYSWNKVEIGGKDIGGSIASQKYEGVNGS